MATVRLPSGHIHVAFLFVPSTRKTNSPADLIGIIHSISSRTRAQCSQVGTKTPKDYPIQRSRYETRAFRDSAVRWDFAPMLTRSNHNSSYRCLTDRQSRVPSRRNTQDHHISTIQGEESPGSCTRSGHGEGPTDFEWDQCRDRERHQPVPRRAVHPWRSDEPC
jgi:hypothetical protein